MDSLERTYEFWAIIKITGDKRYVGPLIIRSRRGGITSTTPPIPTGVNRKVLAHWLSHRIPKSDGSIETIFHVNCGGILES